MKKNPKNKGFDFLIFFLVFSFRLLQLLKSMQKTCCFQEKGSATHRPKSSLIRGGGWHWAGTLKFPWFMNQLDQPLKRSHVSCTWLTLLETITYFFPSSTFESMIFRQTPKIGLFPGSPNSMCPFLTNPKESLDPPMVGFEPVWRKGLFCWVLPNDPPGTWGVFRRLTSFLP